MKIFKVLETWFYRIYLLCLIGFVLWFFAGLIGCQSHRPKFDRDSGYKNERKVFKNLTPKGKINRYRQITIK